MSSANSVRLSFIPETNYNITPANTEDFLAMKFTSESLTGTPLTVESQEIRSDRQSSGQVPTGLELTGDVSCELSNDPLQRLLIEAAMMSEQIPEAINAGVTLDSFTIKAGKLQEVTIGVGVGEMPAGYGVGTVFTFDDVGLNNDGVTFMITNYQAGTTPDIFEAIADVDLVVENVGGAVSFATNPYWDIGQFQRSFSISKEFLDLDDTYVRSTAYTGERVGQMAMTFNYGEIVSAVYSFGGAGYDIPSMPITDGYTVQPAGSSQPFDASGGMPFVALMSDGTAIDLPDICIEALDFTLNNNLNPQQCVGEAAPSNQVAFSAEIEVNVRLYNGVAGFDALMIKKLTQDPIQLGWMVQDSTGAGYTFFLPRLQLNFQIGRAHV